MQTITRTPPASLTYQEHFTLEERIQCVLTCGCIPDIEHLQARLNYLFLLIPPEHVFLNRSVASIEQESGEESNATTLC